MKLVSVTVKNFRCYKNETTLKIDDFTTLIGRNDIGKSSILEALEIFFNNEIVKIDTGDCSVSSPERVIEITCEFSDLPARLILDAQAETTLANEHLLSSNGNLRIKKKYPCNVLKIKEEVVVCANHPTTQRYNDLLELTNAALKKRLADLGIAGDGVQLNNNPSIRQAIWNSCPDLHLVEIEISVDKEDCKRIWDKLKEQLPLFALFQSDRPSRDSDAEVQDPMKTAVLMALAEPEIKQKLSEVTDSVKIKAVELATRTHQSLKKIDPGLASQIVPAFKSDPKWASLFSLTLNTEDGIPLNKRGSGIRRLILVSFFRAEAERRLSENSKSNVIYAIEEPETSQHPHNQRILLDALVDLSSETGCQVLITTHSPGFASYLPIESFRFIKGSPDNHPVISETTDDTWNEIATVLGVVPDNRVKILLCVEGPTDVIAIKCLSKALHLADPTLIDLSCDPRISFVVLGGGTLQHWVNQHYLKGLNRPEVHIYDSDVAKYSAAIAQVNSRTDGSWGVQTHKYEIENYLHADAIFEGLSIRTTINDTDDVPAQFKALANWNPLNAKKKLSLYAFPKMTVARITERDPGGEVKGWLRRIGAML